MKIVVIGGSGRIGSNLVNRLRKKGHEVLAASPLSGVNTITGEGLAQALSGAQIVIDVSNSPSFEDKAAMEFFTTSGRNLLAAEAIADVKHHVALSIVGIERSRNNGYYRAKLAQEALIKSAKTPYSIVRSTQFFEFLESFAEPGSAGEDIRVSPAAFQPIFSDDVAAILSDFTLGAPLNRTVEIGGPDRAGLAEFVQRYLSAIGDTRKVVVDPLSPFWGDVLNDQSLVPGSDARIGRTRFAEWVNHLPRRGEMKKTA
ncbi:MAG: SDR family oxidoreductase [Bdellovibrionia bacterium]